MITFVETIPKTMAEERNTDKLARYIIWAAVAAIIIALCWYFRNVLIYMVLAAVVSLLGRPIMKLLRKCRIKGKSAPDWLLAIITLLLIFSILLAIITQVIPVVSSIISSVSSNLQSASFNASEISRLLDKVNIWLIDRIPSLGRDFKVQEATVNWIRNAFDLTSITSVVGSVASALGSFGIGLFSVMFIGFFFIKDENLFRRIVGSVVPDKLEGEAVSAIGDIEHLLTRYFVGLLTEVIGVALLDFLGLWLIAKLGFYPAIGIAFMAGLLNVIPYVGPLLGDILGVGLCLILKAGAGVGLDVNIWIFALIVFAIMQGTQFVDNFVYQPLIYSTSIKANPLEIFIVLLIAGHIGGPLGMLVAIPSYTVVRVIASRFFYKYKPVRRLIPDRDEEHTDWII